jgi:hypothetical protein
VGKPMGARVPLSALRWKQREFQHESVRDLLHADG